VSEVRYLKPGHSMEGPGAYDAGHGVSYTPYYLDPERKTLGGLWMWHPSCPSRVTDDNGIDGWGPNATTGSAWGYVNEHDPEHITLVGSVLCNECGWHGFVRNGKWEPC